ncbi:uncharacterized protein LACBIDRAFT_310043 [Laccaria bicolor S238N-H82]|uniref:Predicted protein n=1 Tax=Laccaria bicolor (strain S238N-H82 / ATCC MYA-4686) TaxID=486041 RepID=B0DNZ7_LACBS|nr:uncharacterized protein LACBIDRAFT_306916 [Laccaria bicolor S238N-H82]XP_001885671.1 uncharacterized protein LACBIDRAFT_306917 [Laccaria bicolor S238N-H82]XP_001887280.1 uncharacterized protein LACBIDRAFT_310043 [Laccaria bicolor S238N-H82]EDR02123.1 predicted protein [Laccaria bicolor S238N-H82]EDR03734.1 predicted protein [Laccaria bicolor S238N-H82]EDR03818.1 predicted protein [Laccaria bicolor S238N-H82]|eukprot:XP_001885587.1 predicted protein [Laccaria bicolor S238N-H82]
MPPIQQQHQPQPMHQPPPNGAEHITAPLHSQSHRQPSCHVADRDVATRRRTTFVIIEHDYSKMYASQCRS